MSEEKKEAYAYVLILPDAKTRDCFKNVVGRISKDEVHKAFYTVEMLVAEEGSYKITGKTYVRVSKADVSPVPSVKGEESMKRFPVFLRPH